MRERWLWLARCADLFVLLYNKYEDNDCQVVKCCMAFREIPADIHCDDMIRLDCWKYIEYDTRILSSLFIHSCLSSWYASTETDCTDWSCRKIQATLEGCAKSLAHATFTSSLIICMVAPKTGSQVTKHGARIQKNMCRIYQIVKCNCRRLDCMRLSMDHIRPNIEGMSKTQGSENEEKPLSRYAHVIMHAYVYNVGVHADIRQR